MQSTFTTKRLWESPNLASVAWGTQRSESRNLPFREKFALLCMVDVSSRRWHSTSLNSDQKKMREDRAAKTYELFGTSRILSEVCIPGFGRYVIRPPDQILLVPVYGPASKTKNERGLTFCRYNINSSSNARFCLTHTMNEFTPIAALKPFEFCCPVKAVMSC